MFKVEKPEKKKTNKCTVELTEEAARVVRETAEGNSCSVKQAASQMILAADRQADEPDTRTDYPITTIINLTPHPVIVQRTSTSGTVTFPACKDPARVWNDYRPQCTVKDVLIHRAANVVEYSVPEPVPGVGYIVSGIVAKALKRKRQDLLVPFDVHKNTSGEVVYCDSLLRV